MMQKIMTVRRMEKLLSCVSYTSILAGISASAFLASLGSFLRLLTGQAIGTTLYWLPAAGILAFALSLLPMLRLRRFLGKRIRVYPNAESYFLLNSKRARFRPGVWLLLAGSAIVCVAATSFFVTYGTAYFVLSALGLLCLFYGMMAFVRSRLLANLRVKCGEDAEGLDPYDEKKERFGALLRWSVYWIFVLGVYGYVGQTFGNYGMYAFIPVLGALHFAIRIAINNPFSRYGSLRGRRISIHALNLGSLVFLLFGVISLVSNGTDINLAYIHALDYSSFSQENEIRYDPHTGVYTLRSKEDTFRILQLTDIHIGAGINTIGSDRKAFDACYKLIQKSDPDLIIVTGDVVYPIPYQTLNRDNLSAIYQFCEFMNGFGIPWTMVYGNHETESVAMYGAESLSGILNFFSHEQGNSMLYADVQPAVYGRYNQYIRVENPDGSLNRLLFLIDSNDYVPGKRVKEYDSVHEDQIRWYRETINAVSGEEGCTVPSFVFMHIPFGAFADAADALKRGEPDAVYLFGENGEAVSHPSHDSGFFDVILETGSTQAVFVGHDHLNNMGIRYKGVDLVYSKSIDYISYPYIAQKTSQRGGTLIVLERDGSYTIRQVDYEENA